MGESLTMGSATSRLVVLSAKRKQAGPAMGSKALSMASISVPAPVSAPTSFHVDCDHDM